MVAELQENTSELELSMNILYILHSLLAIIEM